MLTPIKLPSAPAPDGANVSNEYATLDSFSKGNQFLLLQQTGGWTRLHDGDGKFIRTLSSAINTSSRPRWSRTDPAVFTYIQGNALYSYNAVSGTALPLKVFTGYIKTTSDGRNGIDDHGEADQVGNVRVIAGKKTDGTEEMFTFGTNTLIKGPSVPVPADVDGLKLTADLKIVVSRPSGIFVDGRQLFPSNHHGCCCVYKGVPHYAMFNGDKNLILIDIATAKQTVVPFIVDSSVYVAHVSSCDKPFLVVSASAPKNDAPSQIVRISLDDLSAEVLCETHTVYRDYGSQPKAALSRDGSRIVYGADDGKVVSAYMLKLDAVPISTNPTPMTFDASKFGMKVERGTITIYPT